MATLNTVKNVPYFLCGPVIMTLGQRSKSGITRTKTHEFTLKFRMIRWACLGHDTSASADALPSVPMGIGHAKGHTRTLEHPWETGYECICELPVGVRVTHESTGNLQVTHKFCTVISSMSIETIKNLSVVTVSPSDPLIGLLSWQHFSSNTSLTSCQPRKCL